MTEMSASQELESYIPRPEKADGKRHMIAVDPKAYDAISKLADKHDTTRGRTVGAIVQFFLNSEE